jgi:hypothetical protein
MASSSSPAWRLISSPVPTVPSVAMTELGVTEGSVVRIRGCPCRGRDRSLSTATDITKQGPLAAADIGAMASRDGVARRSLLVPRLSP